MDAGLCTNIVKQGAGPFNCFQFQVESNPLERKQVRSGDDHHQGGAGVLLQIVQGAVVPHADDDLIFLELHRSEDRRVGDALFVCGAEGENPLWIFDQFLQFFQVHDSSLGIHIAHRLFLLNVSGPPERIFQNASPE